MAVCNGLVIILLQFWPSSLVCQTFSILFLTHFLSIGSCLALVQNCSSSNPYSASCLLRTHPYVYHVNIPTPPPIRRLPSSPNELLIEMLQRDYHKHERPMIGGDVRSATVVEINIDLLSITSISVVDMEFTLDLYLRQEWIDPRLAWGKLTTDTQGDDEDDCILLTQQKSSLWLPDLYFRNGKHGFLHEVSIPNFMLRVWPTGKVLYSQKFSLTLSCSMYLKNFPFDTQDCGLDIGSYSFEVSELQFVWRASKPVKVGDDLQVLEFERPTEASASNCSNDYRTGTGSYSCLWLNIPLKRFIVSYLVTTYIQQMLIVMVSWLGFWIDARAAPARVALGLFTLLGLLTECSSLSSSLPRVTYTKAIDVWIITCLVFVIGALAEFAIAYKLAPEESSESTLQADLLDLVQGVLEQSIGQSRCCCCYTQSKGHRRPATLLHRPQPTFQSNQRKPFQQKPAIVTLSSDARAQGRDPSIQSSVKVVDTRSTANVRCRLCAQASEQSAPVKQISIVAQPGCCKCSDCIRLQCPKAPSRKKGVHQVRIVENPQTLLLPASPLPPQRSPITANSKRSRAVDAFSASPLPTSIPSAVSSNRRSRSLQSNHKQALVDKSGDVALTVKMSSNRSVSSQPSRRSRSSQKVLYNNNTLACDSDLTQPTKWHQWSGLKKQVAKLNCLSCRRCERLRSFANRPRRQPSPPPIFKTNQTYDSPIDACCRILFPLAFLLFNICYWSVYLGSQ